MANEAAAGTLTPLNTTERLTAAVAAMALMGAALWLVVAPPEQDVVLAQCAKASEGCIVQADRDVTVFSGVLAGLGALAGLIAVLGVRFNTVRVGAAEVGQTEGLATAPPAQRVGPESVPSAASRPEPVPTAEVPVEVTVVRGEGADHGQVPVAVTRLAQPIPEVDPPFLREYQMARRASQREYFLTHTLGPATQPGQKFSVAIRVTPHRDATVSVTSAAFYLGRAWGHRVFSGSAGSDGRFGMVTQAYGPFLALCEVEFEDGTRLLLDHYCDFDMGDLVAT